MIRIGTSGYNYPEWKGTFYPKDLPASKMLRFYAERFTTVEINYTFYRMPSEKTLSNWDSETPSDFAFTLKASRRITHQNPLKDKEETVRVLLSRAQVLGPKLALVLFQLPPYFRKDLDTLESFLETLPSKARAAFEFRHRSWMSDDVFTLLRDRNLALCITDSEKLTTPVVNTADFSYYRLRDEGYDEHDIAGWAEKIKANSPTSGDVFVYFKHEEEGKGAEFAKLLSEHLGQA